MRTLFLLTLIALFSGCNGDVDPDEDKQDAVATPELHTLSLEKSPKVTLTQAEIDGGWIQLFDGQSLVGWHANNDVDWHVNDDGEIQAKKGEAGLLLTNVPFADYELRCDYWVSQGANSGIFLRTVDNPKDPTTECYELNICDSHEKFKTASLVGRTHPSQEVTGEEVWKTFHITVEGDSITAKLDGVEVLDFFDESEGQRFTGAIGLQKNEGLVKFRNVYLKPIGGEPLFNGIDLDGWRVVPGSEGTFEVNEDDYSILAKGGLGFLETVDEWDNFILQFEAKTNGKDTNSGIFFRLNPGTKKSQSDGYELQIDSSVIGDDQSKPKNAGTGAVFRRTTARWVGSKDDEWFTATLVAHGDRFAVWVNGFQVTDWQDTRKADPNPRRGLKLGPGPFSLQAHDATTDISFRNLRVTEYPAK